MSLLSVTQDIVHKVLPRGHTGHQDGWLRKDRDAELPAFMVPALLASVPTYFMYVVIEIVKEGLVSLIKMLWQKLTQPKAQS